MQLKEEYSSMLENLNGRRQVKWIQILSSTYLGLFSTPISLANMPKS